MAVEMVTLIDQEAGSRAAVLTGFGFNCFEWQVVVDGQPVSLLWAAESFASGTERPSHSGIPILFPFPGRLRGTELEWEGKTYKLREGDGAGNAIHGFLHERPWRVIDRTASSVTGQFQASVDDPSLLSSWPADFRVTATYELKGNALRSRFLVENPSDRPLPCGLGTHPYFRVPIGNGTADECQVRVPVSTQWEINGMLATGEQRPLEDPAAFQQGLRFGDMQFDAIFGGVEFQQGLATAALQDPQSGRTLVMTFSDAFRECVLYNPPHRQAVCMEPYTCVPDPIELHKQGNDGGLRLLAPGESFTATVEMRLE